MAKTIADQFAEILAAAGVKRIYGIAGDRLNGLTDALRRPGEIEWVQCPSRGGCALCGDGGFTMLMGEFLTAAHHKLPVKVVVYNNSAFGLISFEAESVGLPAYKKGIEFPNPDYVALARACGG